MSALIPIKNDPAKNEVAMAGIIADKRRDAIDGYDGGWVAHPGLVEASMKEFVAVLGDRPNQFDKQKPEVAGQGRRPARLQARGADHRGRPAHEHQRRHPLPRRLARRQRLRADPQPDGRRRHRRDQPQRRSGSGSARPRACSTTAARSPPSWCARSCPRSWRRSRPAASSASSTAPPRSSPQMSTQDAFAEFLTLPLYEEL